VRKSVSMTKKQPERILNRDGSLNVIRKGFRFTPFSDAYHHLLSMPWPSFFVLIVFIYILINFFFGGAYFLCGRGAFQGLEDTQLPFFWNCFFFSVQTIATIGYGHIHPVNLVANLIITLESFVGILELAMVTGLFFSRFSKPTARVVFSKVALMTHENSIPCLMFRVANARKSQITEAHINMVMLRNETTKEGVANRKLCDLKLDRNFSPLFALSWTVVHIIDASSPLFGADAKKLKEMEAAFMVSLSGRDEIYAQQIHAKNAYTMEDIVWNAQFKDMLTLTQTHALINLNEIDSVMRDK
jgi:inward rectifier potassium channel